MISTHVFSFSGFAIGFGLVWSFTMLWSLIEYILSHSAHCYGQLCLFGGIGFCNALMIPRSIDSMGLGLRHGLEGWTSGGHSIG